MKVVAKPHPTNTTTQPPQANTNASVNPENQKPPTSESNPPPLEDAPVHVITPWPKAGRISGKLFELRKDWPIPPTTNTATAAKSKLLVIKVEPQDPDQSNPN